MVTFGCVTAIALFVAGVGRAHALADRSGHGDAAAEPSDARFAIRSALLRGGTMQARQVVSKEERKAKRAERRAARKAKRAARKAQRQQQQNQQPPAAQ